MALRDLDSTYLGVSVDDRDPQALFDSMLALAETRLPQWEPRNGSLEVVLMEACAVGMADLVYAANRVMGSMVEGMISLYGVTRDEGTPATGTVRLTLTGSPTTTIDEGTLFRIDDADSRLVATETAGQRLVDGVVHHLEHHVVQSTAVVGVTDIHAWTLADSIQALQNLDAGRVVNVFVSHGHLG